MEKAEKNWSRNLQRVLIISSIIASVILVNIYEIISLPMNIFMGIIMIILFVNLWLYERKESGWYFVIPLLLASIFILLFILSLIGWTMGSPVFKGFWADIFGWRGLITAFVFAFYCIILLDGEMRQCIKNALSLKRSSKQEEEPS